MGLCSGASGGIGPIGEYYAIDLDVSELAVYGGLGEAMNTAIFYEYPPVLEYWELAAFSWDLTIETVGTSWVSEVSFGFMSGGESLVVAPGVGIDEPATVELVQEPWITAEELGLEALEFDLGTGMMFEIFDSFDDGDGVDAYFGVGSTFTMGFYIPSAGTGVVVLAGVGVVARRRRG